VDDYLLLRLDLQVLDGPSPDFNRRLLASHLLLAPRVRLCPYAASNEELLAHQLASYFLLESSVLKAVEALVIVHHHEGGRRDLSLIYDVTDPLFALAFHSLLFHDPVR
jgi:hypothetical protein